MVMHVEERVAAEAMFREVLAQPDEKELASGWGTDLSTFLRRASPVHGDAFLIVTDRRVLVIPIEKALAVARDGVTREVVGRLPLPFSVRRDAITSSRRRRRAFGHLAEFTLGDDVMPLRADRSLVDAMLRVPNSKGPLSASTTTMVTDPALPFARCEACWITPSP